MEIGSSSKIFPAARWILVVVHVIANIVVFKVNTDTVTFGWGGICWALFGTQAEIVQNTLVLLIPKITVTVSVFIRRNTMLVLFLK